jgi:hypothetical protein
VLIKFKAPNIELAPAKCNEKIPKSIPNPACPIFLERGGYIVHPVPKPFPLNIEKTNKTKEIGSNQNLKFFKRAKDISKQLNIKGINQFPKPPINIGITKKNIIIKP